MKQDAAPAAAPFAGRQGADLRTWISEHPRRAHDDARAVLAAHPDDGLARLILAECERRLGNPGEALRVCDAASRPSPPLVLEAARALLALERDAEARQRVEGLLVALPDFAPGWKMLADLRERAGDSAGAQAAARNFAKAAAGPEELLRAAELLQSGRLGQAEHLLRTYVKANPLDVSGIRLLASVALQLGVLDDACKLLERCLDLAPDFHLARHDYANALIKLQRYDAAEAELARLSQAEPDAPSHKVLQALLKVRTGQLEAACAIYASVLEAYPHQARVQLSYGHALKTLGRQEDAVTAYRDAIRAEPTLGEAYWSLANLKTVRFDDTDIAAMRTALTADGLSIQDRYHLNFALGKALEDHKAFDDAFAAYADGNAIRRKTIRYDADRIEAESGALKGFFTRAFFEERRDWGDPSPDPIFIVGLPRSGSTLLEQILASHTQVDGTFELPDIISIARRLSGKKRVSDPSLYPQVLADLDRPDVAALGREYLDRTRVHRQGAPRFIDKMPNNFTHIGLIKLILPNATIIDARRNPMACGFSNFKQLFAKGQNFSYSLEEIGRYYANYLDLMAFWDTVLPGQVLRMVYEDVVDELETQVRRVLGFCALEFEPSCVAFHSTNRAVRTASSEQVRQPIFTSGLDQWRHFSAHLDPLRDALGEAAGASGSRER